MNALRNRRRRTTKTKTRDLPHHHRSAHNTNGCNYQPIFTMVFSVAAAAARRRIAFMAAHKTSATQQCQRRAMGSGPAPEWEGIDKVVRGAFPHDHQRTSFCPVSILVRKRFQIPFPESLTTKNTSYLSYLVFVALFAVAMAIMGGYSSLFVLYKIKSAFSKPKQGEPAITPAGTAGDASPGQGMPAVDSPEFGSFLETDRFHKMLESDDFGHMIEGTKA
jgi:hypothetical protein